jgi:uncharacterized protein (DUF427 family)
LADRRERFSVPAVKEAAAMKIPGPDHPITIKLNPRRVQALYGGHVIADSERALSLKEASYKPVQYFPREDVAMDFLQRTSLSTNCPYKGDAAYFTVARDGEISENAVWTYEHPYPAMEQIRGYLAFYPNKVEIREIDEGMDADAIRDVVEHTDSGSGRSQLEHWPANVVDPLKV